MATYYVDQGHGSASDSNAGTSESAPWLTLTRATGQTGPGGLVAGDTCYVKNGTYLAPSTGDAAFNSSNSGTSGNPIAFRRSTGHNPVLDRSSTPHHDEGFTAPSLFINGRNYVTWDGFTCAAWTAVQVATSTGAIIENMTINPGVAVDPDTENYCGIYVSNGMTDGIIRYNRISNAQYTVPRQNASGITGYQMNNCQIYNNEISGCSSGVFLKQNCIDTVVELNYLHDMTGDSILVTGFVVPGACGACLVERNKVRNNVIVGGTLGIRFNLADTEADQLEFYNNTVYNVTNMQTADVEDLSNWKFYNNIAVIADASTAQMGFYGFSPSGLVQNYQCFRRVNSNYWGISVAGIVRDLATWQANSVHDDDSISQDPLFVGPTTTVAGFKLQGSSPCLNTGRVGGTSAGAVTNMGAYAVGTEVIGIPLSAAASELVRLLG